MHSVIEKSVLQSFHLIPKTLFAGMCNKLPSADDSQYDSPQLVQGEQQHIRITL